MDDVRLPEFDIGDGEDARTHGRRSVQSGRVEFITRGDRRRVWAVEQKRAIALESMDPAGAPSDVARRYGISNGLLCSATVYPYGQVRTLQRRMKGWRQAMAHQLVFGVATPPAVQETDVQADVAR